MWINRLRRSDGLIQLRHSTQDCYPSPVVWEDGRWFAGLWLTQSVNKGTMGAETPVVSAIFHQPHPQSQALSSSISPFIRRSFASRQPGQMTAVQHRLTENDAPQSQTAVGYVERSCGGILRSYGPLVPMADRLLQANGFALEPEPATHHAFHWPPTWPSRCELRGEVVVFPAGPPVVPACLHV